MTSSKYLKRKNDERKSCQRIKGRKPDNSIYDQRQIKKETLVIQWSVQLIVTPPKTKYEDYHLQPNVEEIPSYVKDTKDFIQKLNQIKK